jgi:hypothetical protein
MVQGKVRSTWFERHGTTPITEIPSHWSQPYRQAVEARIALIRADRKIRLLERPEYKRRWNWASWEEMEKVALRTWLLNWIEALDVWQLPELQAVARMADRLRKEPAAVEAAQLLIGRTDLDPDAVVTDLIQTESVPYLAALRLRPSGLVKRQAWEATWELQRREDELEARNEAVVSRIPIPPKYTSKDFVRSSWWSHRGKLDVPKERFMSVPGTRVGSDPSAVFGWAGWNHLERAQALAAHFGARNAEGADPKELIPLLAGVAELVPWLLQWHNDLDPTYGARMGEFFKGFVEDAARALDLTTEDLRAWSPD